MEPPKQLRKQYEIKLYESDALGRATLPALCNYFQDIASLHYNRVDSIIGPLLGKTQIWIMARLEIEIGTLPRWQDVIEVETWSRGIEKLYAFRDFIMTGTDSSAVVKGSATWVVLDTASMKIIRLNDIARKFPSEPHRAALGKSADKVSNLTTPLYGKPFEIKYSDMDVNRHVNNVQYIKWMSDRLGRETLETLVPQRCVVNFIDESMAGEDIKSGMEKVSDTEYNCNIVRVLDEKELCRAKFIFRKQPSEPTL